MTNEQSSEKRRISIREQVARLVNIFPNEFAVPMLRSLGFERPELSRYYVEIDRAIQTYLQKKLAKLGYSGIIPNSLGRSGSNLNYDNFAYGYLLSYTGKTTSPVYIGKYIRDAQQRLISIIQLPNVEFDNFPPKDHIYARVNPDNRMYVAKGRSEK